MENIPDFFYMILEKIGDFTYYAIEWLFDTLTDFFLRLGLEEPVAAPISLFITLAAIFFFFGSSSSKKQRKGKRK
ncbi:hypothetical protein F9U64_18660 [Gracilibacillus oryzae]|uniref:Uncharacterized protein n=1 Tax=Gracilibacillus oryzae TaxID=1672701 RepID=A0A7C8GRV9_9BACI|nr:hypothetical protein [Gracilibacillus oryzae]KAB8127038.1 hypothetical protein F9U64_18660 [Gracilibacillus oryzae]